MARPVTNSQIPEGISDTMKDLRGGQSPDKRTADMRCSCPVSRARSRWAEVESYFQWARRGDDGRHIAFTGAPLGAYFPERASPHIGVDRPRFDWRERRRTRMRDLRQL